MILALLVACTGETAEVQAPSPAPPPPPLVGGSGMMERFEPLQGRWDLVDDPRSQVLILKSLWMEGYDGAQQSQTALEWADGCRADGGRPSPTGAYLNLLSEPPRCMQLGAVTADTLELIVLPEGRSLRYVRAIGGQ
ncbi:MAG: hypothetical protein ACI8RZ_001384 [Myxococcota bacterium]|jgi:hypothetical protein